MEQLELFPGEDLVVKEFLARYIPSGVKEWHVPENPFVNKQDAFELLEKTRAAEADFLARDHMRYVG